MIFLFQLNKMGCVERILVVMGLCVVLAVAQEQRTECCEEYCYGSDSDRPQSQWFASKAVYQIARGVDMSRHSEIPSEYIYKATH